jgi:hypothetical protein
MAGAAWIRANGARRDALEAQESADELREEVSRLRADLARREAEEAEHRIVSLRARELEHRGVAPEEAMRRAKLQLDEERRQSREQERAHKAVAAKSEREQAQALSDVKDRSSAAVGAPSSLAFTVNNGALTLFWRPDNGHPMSRKDFVIDIKKSGGPSWRRLNGAVKRSVDRSPTAIPLSEFEPGAAYILRVRDNLQSKSSPWSKPLTITLP